MFLWGFYQIVIVILMNLLIALMNTTIARIHENKITQWRFARTKVLKLYYFSIINYLSTLDLETLLWSIQNLLPPCPFQSFGNVYESCHDDHQKLHEEEKRRKLTDADGRAWKSYKWQREEVSGPDVQTLWAVHSDEKENWRTKMSKPFILICL